MENKKDKEQKDKEQKEKSKKQKVQDLKKILIHNIIYRHRLGMDYYREYTSYDKLEEVEILFNSCMKVKSGVVHHRYISTYSAHPDLGIHISLTEAFVNIILYNNEYYNELIKTDELIEDD